MKPYKPSFRVLEILAAIRDRCYISGMWVPGKLGGTSDWCQDLGYFVNINGMGDASIIRSLKNRGLLSKSSSSCGPYHFLKIAEDGILILEQAWDAGVLGERK